MTLRLAGNPAFVDPQSTLYDIDPLITVALPGLEALALPAPPGRAAAVSDLAAAAAASSGPGQVAVTDSVGTNGAADMQVPAAIATFDVTGAGLRVGILSDSFDSQGTADLLSEEGDGDLPGTVDILSDYAGGSDEGRAMAEVVHAVAPGAAIDFATANSTDLAFAEGILSLAAAGCNIIVDDVTYFDEPFFEDSNVIQLAVQTVIAEGVSYFTAASNEGVNYYQAPVDLVAGKLPNAARFSGNVMLENFGTTAAAYSGSDTLQDIAISIGTTLDFDLQWTQPFETNGAGVTIDPTGSAYTLAMFLFNGKSLVASATANVTGGDPVQVMQFVATTSGTYELAIELAGGTVPSGDILKYIVYESYTTGGSLVTIEDSNAGQGSGDITGHELVGGANTVGAVNASSPTTPEDYSSYGPGTLDTYSASGVLTGSTVENKVNVLAPDGIATSVSDFSTFFGTSAAAPDAAAVAALMLQANPNLTPAQVTATLEATATAVSGNVDEVGAGLVDADAAVLAVNGAVWTAAAGGSWSTAADWSLAQAPGTADPATLSNDFGTLTASYTVQVSGTGAVADTLTVGNVTTPGTGAVPGAITLAIGAGDRLGIASGATVAQQGTLSVAGGGTLAVGGLAELTDPSAVLTLQTDAVMTAAVVEIGSGTLTVGAGARLTAGGSIDLEISVNNGGTISYDAIPYGLATGGGLLSIAYDGVLAITGGGGVLLGGSLAIAAGGTLTDSNTGGVGLLVLGGTLTDDGTLGEANALLVNTDASVTIGAGGVLSAASVDVEGTGASLTVSGTLTDPGALTGAASGNVTIARGGEFSIGGAMSGPGLTVDHGGLLVLATGDTTVLTTELTGTISLAAGQGTVIDLAGLTYVSGESLSVAGDLVDVMSGSTLLAALEIGRQATQTLSLGKDAAAHAQILVACYRQGTRIATPTGEVPVESLCIGDVVLTASGRVRPVHWVGRRSYDPETVAAQRKVQPIRIHAGALGAGLPRRDLDVSPEHAVLLQDEDGAVLVPACRLVNGLNVRRLPAAEAVAYVHIELRAHDAILAEGQAAETFVDDSSRAGFENAADYAARYPGEAPRPASYFAPRIESGAVLARLRAGIDARAGLRPGGLLSSVDRAGRDVVGGWAHDPDNPHCPVLLEIVADGAVIATVLADRYRADLTAINRAGGYCSFVHRLPVPLDAARRHIVSVRRAADGVTLRGMPALIDRLVPAETLVRRLLAEPVIDSAEMAGFLTAQIDVLRSTYTSGREG